MKTSSVKSSAVKKDWHKKIAKNRGKSWVRNIAAGRREAQLNPSLIRLMRIQKGIFQDKLAASVKISESVYGAIERGRQKVKRPRAKLIADRLNANMDQLFRQVSSKGKKEDHKFVAILRKTSLR